MNKLLLVMIIMLTSCTSERVNDLHGQSIDLKNIKVDYLITLNSITCSSCLDTLANLLNGNDSYGILLDKVSNPELTLKLYLSRLKNYNVSSQDAYFTDEYLFLNDNSSSPALYDLANRKLYNYKDIFTSSDTIQFTSQIIKKFRGN